MTPRESAVRKFLLGRDEEARRLSRELRQVEERDNVHFTVAERECLIALAITLADEGAAD